VVAALQGRPRSAADIRSPLRPGGASLISANGRSALVTFTIPGNSDNENQTVAADLNAMAAIQARHPGLLIRRPGTRAATARSTAW
jgi:putative drug exporter of the RND superfamily